MKTSTESEWTVLARCHGKDEEFDWLARDVQGHVAVFASAGKGPIPTLVWSHRLQYNGLVTCVKLLPRGGFVKVYRGPGNYSEWQDIADFGLYAFDYQDVHRVQHLKRYDLIARPISPISCNALPKEFAGWLPLLDTQFSEVSFVPDHIAVPE